MGDILDENLSGLLDGIISFLPLFFAQMTMLLGIGAQSMARSIPWHLKK
jgi:hypothetical protein